MHEKQQIVRAGLKRLVHTRDYRRVLADEPCPRGDATIHPHAFLICAMPLSPAVALRGFNSDAVMIADNIRQRLQAQRSRVIFIRTPGRKLQVRYRLDHLRVIAKRKLGPLLSDLPCAQIRIPRQASKAIEIRL